MALENVKHRAKMVMNMATESKKIGAEDPRKILHSLKVGLAMAAVSLIYYFDLFRDGYSTGSGLYAMWAVNTVAVVFEFSIGATIGKGVNRTLATVVGGALGVGAHGATSFAGNTAESIMLAFIIFFICGVATFGRFIPKLKARNDYFFLIVIVTYGLIAVSTFRGEKLIEMAEKRLSTVLVGYATVLVCCCICPCWAGQDLHTLVATNIDTLGTFLADFGDEYFETANSNDKSHEIRASMEGYRAVINSKSVEESLVNFAKWEPRHGKFRYWHPWDHYVKIGAFTRECACKLDALHACLDSDMQAPSGIRERMKEACTAMSSECGNALREAAQGMRTMTRSALADAHVSNAEAGANNLKLLLQTPVWGDARLLDVCPAATVASLLVQIVSCTADVVDSVHQLANLSKFSNPNEVKPHHTHADVVLVNLPIGNVER
ncbi:aluminum-activated malate transporter 2-like [Salvia miltiorrhiza]|uniref:aluminum-activated malate transporter 2-like n=1 Tax=Salvia miltiorrhiza TaxID=226208 RepID=UPI0025AC0479|nr:aluminum-activated malate transporter 2-like [Salvia miltiorrhiza]